MDIVEIQKVQYESGMADVSCAKDLYQIERSS